MFFAAHCPTHDKRYLVSVRSLQSLHNTPEGPLGHVVLPCGHEVVHSFRWSRSTPVATAS